MHPGLESLEDRVLLAATNPLELATLDGTNGFTLNGVAALDRFGFSVSGAGDVNGDGFDDLLIGAVYAGSNGANSGAAYLVFGTAEGTQVSLELATLDGTNGFTLNGVAALDQTGSAVSGAGDVNGDGFDDLLIGAHFADPNGSKSGASYVVFGGTSNLSALDAVTSSGGTAGDGRINLADLDGTTGFVLNGSTEGDYSGEAVSGAGDVNGDGFDDLLIGARHADPNGSKSGASYLVFGGTSNLSSLDAVTSSGGTAGDGRINLADLDGTTGFVLNGIGADDRSGRSVSGAGDVNGDGIDDLLIGTDWSNETLGNEQAFVVFGGTSNLSALDAVTISGGAASDGRINLADLDGTTGFMLNGTSVFGIEVSSAGDVNGDGFDDLLIGSSQSDYFPDTFSTGLSFVVFGGMSHLSTLDAATSSGGTAGDGRINLADVLFLDQAPGFILIGVSSFDRFGGAVSGAGDVNGDGYDDLLIGAFGADPNGSESGASYVVFGGTSNLSALDAVTSSGGMAGDRLINLADLDGTTGFVLNGVDAGDVSGFSVSIAGDVNGDGFDDVLIGAQGAEPKGERSGESYVVFGGNFTGGLGTQVGTSSADTLTGTAAADVLIGGRGADVLLGNGGEDVLYGGEGDDVLAIGSLAFARLDGGNGADTLRLGGSGLALDLTTIADNKVTDIEVIDLTGNGANTLTLDLQEVLNISSHSNTLLVRRDAGDTVNIGSGWTQGASQTIDSVSYDILTQGAAVLGIQSLPRSSATRTVTLPTGGGTYTVALSADGLKIEVRETLPTASLVASVPLSEVGTLGINGSESDDLVTLGDLTGFAGTIIFVAGGGDDLYDASATAINSRVIGGAGNDTFLGGSGNDNVDGGAGADSLSGGAGNDQLKGNSGNDTLSGGDGNDFLNGAAGNDLLTGDGGNDTLLGGGGTDTLDGGAGDDFVNGQGGQADIVAGGGGTDTLRGGASDILLPGSAGTIPVTPTSPEVTGSTLNVALPSTGGPFTILINETQLQVTSATGTITDVPLADVSGISLTGSDGDDAVILDVSLSAFAGNVSLNGAAGNDSLDSSATTVNTAFAGGAGNDSLTGGGGNDIFVGGDGDDFATGGAGNDSLTGEAGNDNFSGGDGDDFLNGNNGSDTLFGGVGSDILLGGRDADLLDGGDGSDIVNGQGGTGDTVAGGGGGTDSLRGDSSDSLIVGPSGHAPENPGEGGGNVVDGILTVTLPAVGGSFNFLVAAGQLQVTPSAGDTPLVDEAFAGISDIVINGGPGSDVVVLDASLTALTGSLVLNGGTGSDSLDSSAYTGRVVFNGGDGDDTFLGGSGNDTANGGAGNDSIFTGAGTDLIHAGIGDDFVDAGADDDTVFGENGDDVLIGGAGDDILNGNGGSDTITGEDGDDKLLGGADADSLDGGLGDDTVRGQGGDLDIAIGGGGIDVVVP
jgi:Ca2+-binding RTX toxin-like protein